MMYDNRMINRKITRLIVTLALGALGCLAYAADTKPQPADTTKNPPNWGQRRDVSFRALQKHFAQPDMIYAPFMFWFWDEPLQPGKAAEMARVMLSQNISPGYPHARMAKTPGCPDLPVEQWLSPQWFESFDGALKQVEAKKSYLGYCDEYWWPGLQGRGRVLQARPDLKAQSLAWQTFDLPAGGQIQVPASFFAVAAQIDKDLPPVQPEPQENQKKKKKKHDDAQPDAPFHRPALIRGATLQVVGSGQPFTWKAPAEGRWRVYVFNTYFHPGADGGEVNYLDDRLAQVFIDMALEPYAKRYGKRLGRTIPGDFVDNEGDYGYKLAWSDTLDQRYRERTGRDIRLWMPLLVDEDAEGLYGRARWEWFDVVSDIYAENLGAVTQWHERRGMYTTVHLWEETLQVQTLAVGDHLKMLRAYTMPGQDCLWLRALEPHDFKEPQSVAEFEGRRLMSEMMGVAGWEQFNPTILRQCTNAAVAWGVGHMIPHGVFMTRKFDGNPWPPDWYDHNPMFRYLHRWADYARRASYINSHGRLAADVLLLNPMDTVWALTGTDVFDPAQPMNFYGQPGPSAASVRMTRINEVYSQTIKDLTTARVEFLVGDRHYLRQMDVKGGRLVRGEHQFKAVILPPLDILPLDVARKLLAFAQSGGRVYALGELPTGSTECGMNDRAMQTLMKTLSGQPTFKACGAKGLKAELDAAAPGLASQIRFASGAFPMLQHHLRIDGRDFFWLANSKDEWQEATLLVSEAHGRASIWDCETGKIRPVNSSDVKEGSQLKLVFKPSDAFWLVFEPQKRAYDGPPEHRPATETVASLDGPWKVSVDPKTQPVMEHPSAPPPELLAGAQRPLAPWKTWGMDRFSGLVDYETTLTVGKAKGPLQLDLGKVRHTAEVWINGKPVGQKLWGPHVFDVTGALRKGPNTIRVRVANLIANSYGQSVESGLLGPVRLVRQIR